jgi:hypothetical protein
VLTRSMKTSWGETLLFGIAFSPCLYRLFVPINVSEILFWLRLGLGMRHDVPKTRYAGSVHI